MSSGKSAAPAAVLVKGAVRPPAVWQFLLSVVVMAEMEVRKLRHDPTELLTRAVQPVLWLLIFGQVFSRVRAFNTGGVPYQAFMTPGILAQSVMFIAIFFGIAIIWERDMGILAKFLAMPIPRVALVLGKAFAAGVRALAQAVIVLGLAAAIGVQLRWNLPDLLAAAVVAVLGAMFFATLSMVIAALVKTRERFMGIGQVITMPLFFASNALYPVSVMPPWLQAIARVNPLSYMVDFLRGALVTGQLRQGPLDVLVLVVACTAVTVLGNYLYPTVIR